MKVALCFIINYEHTLNKEHIWREWIKANSDIINVYFFYSDHTKIKSDWILKHVIPKQCIHPTSYFHVIPAYLSLLNYALKKDSQNKWFCLLTDSCCPIISPKRFRYLFFEHWKQNIFSWRRAWWNPYLHKRGNLSKLKQELWLANDPWFTLTREYAKTIVQFAITQPNLLNLISDGGLANESLFAIIFKFYGILENNKVINYSSHIVDWTRMTSATSPHVFREGNTKDIEFIDTELERNPYVMFIRKVSPDFSDDILYNYIYEYNKDADKKLVIKRNINKTYLFVICCIFYISLYYLFI